MYLELGGKKNFAPRFIKRPKRYMFWDFVWEIDEVGVKGRV